MYKIANIDKKIYKCITDDITTDEVIITDERIAHINARHPNDYAKIAPFLQEALLNPDYILKDRKRKNTGIILKTIQLEDTRIQIVLRLQTSSDNPGLKNSIVSAWKIGKSRWDNYIRNKEILYKKQE